MRFSCIYGILPPMQDAFLTFSPPLHTIVIPTFWFWSHLVFECTFNSGGNYFCSYPQYLNVAKIIIIL